MKDITNQSLMYVVNDKFEIIEINQACRRKLPDLRLGEICYKVINKNDAPCKGCPLLSGMDSNNTFYNKALNEWFSTDICQIERDNKPAYLLLQKPIKEDTSDIFTNVLKEETFDVLAEFDLDNGTFRLIKSHPLLKKFESGKIEELGNIVAQEFIESFDYYRFKKFIEIKSIIKRINKNTKEPFMETFRLKSFIQAAEWVSIEILPYNMSDDLTTKVLATITFINPNKLNNNEEAALNYNQLTGLLFGASYLNRAEEFIHRHEEEGIAIASIDIDHFKIFNEWYGNTAGDLFLQDVGHTLHSYDEQYGTFSGYLGNDNFCIIMPHYKEHIDRLARVLINTSKQHGDSTGFLPAIGIYPILNLDETVSKMFDRATIAASTIKDGHANRVSIYSSRMLNAIEAEYKLLHDVMEGIKNDEFVVYFQPKVNILNGNKIFSAEALVRWPKDGRIIEPNSFIPVLEKTGSIVDLDTYVWERTIMWLKSLIDRGIKPVPVAVNVSRIDLYYLDVVGIFKRLVEKHNVPSSLVELEIKESAYVERLENIQRIVDELRSLGFRIALDDFGAGYSSLNVLKSINVDTLKLDIKFLELEGEEKKGLSILESVINMIKSIDLKIICEGVETLEQVEILKKLGCQYVQGFYFYRPMPSQNFEQFLVMGTNIDYKANDSKRVSSIRFSEFLGYLSKSDMMADAILGPVAFLETNLENDTVDILKVNSKFSEITGLLNNNEITYKEKIKKSIFQEDLLKLKDLFLRAIKNPVDGATELIRQSNKDNLIHLEIHLFYIGERAKNKLFYASCKDLTNAKLLEEQVKKNNKKLIETLRLENVDSWEFDVKKKTLRIFNPTNKALIRILKGKNTFYDFPNGAVEKGILTKEVGKRITSFLNSASDGVDNKYKERVFDFSVHAGNDLVWIRCQYKAIDVDSELRLIVGSYRDITNDVIRGSSDINLKALEILKEASIYSSFVSLTDNIAYNLEHKELTTAISISDASSYDTLADIILTYSKNKDNIRDYIKRDSLIEAYNNHQCIVSLDLKCSIEGVEGIRRLSYYMYEYQNKIYAYCFLGNTDELERNRIRRNANNEIIDSLGCGFMRFDYNTKNIALINDLALAIYGYRTIDGFNNDILENHPVREYEEDKPNIDYLREELTEEHDSIDFTYRVFVDGKTKYIVANEELVRIDNKLYIQRLFLDYTADKERDLELLKDEEHHFQQALKASNFNKSILIGINKLFVSSYTCDLNNNKYQAMKYTKVTSELISMSKTFDEYMLNYCKLYVHDDDKNMFKAMTQRDYIKKHITYENDRYSLIYRRRVDKSFKWFKMYIIASSFDLNGKVDTIIYAIRDIDNDTVAIKNYQKRVEYYKDLFLSSSVDVYSGMLLIDLRTLACSDIKFDDKNITETKYDKLWDELLELAIKRIDSQYVDEIRENLSPDNLFKQPSGYSKTIKYKLNEDNGEYKFVSTTIRILEYNDDKLATLFTIDLTDDIKSLELLKERSLIDELTGLGNRKKLDDYKSYRFPSLSSCGVIFFDINNLKVTNDSLGHGAGDILIKTAASSIISILDDGITGYRYGGDEFIVIYENCTEEALLGLIHKWESALIRCNSISKIVCTMSLGYIYSKERKSLDELILEADKEMYQSKKSIKSSNRGNETSRLSSILKYLDNDYLFIYEIDTSNDRYRLLHVNDLVLDKSLLRGLSYEKALKNIVDVAVIGDEKAELLKALSLNSLKNLSLDGIELSYTSAVTNEPETIVVKAMDFEGGICKRVTLAQKIKHLPFK